MALQPASGACQCRSDTTEDAWSVATESTSGRRLVLRALTYLHVQDQDTGVTRLVAGPCSYTLKENQRSIGYSGHLRASGLVLPSFGRHPSPIPQRPM